MPTSSILYKKRKVFNTNLGCLLFSFNPELKEKYTPLLAAILKLPNSGIKTLFPFAKFKQFLNYLKKLLNLFSIIYFEYLINLSFQISSFLIYLYSCKGIYKSNSLLYHTYEKYLYLNHPFFSLQ